MKVANRVLLLSHKFPPYAGVGCYRWSKLCKQLAESGREIHVITVRWQSQGPNTLSEDVTHPNIHIHRIPSGYPHNLKRRKLKPSWVNVLKSKMQIMLNRVAFYDDEAQHWGKHLVPFARKLIAAKGIEKIVATGHPFQVNRWAAVLRSQMSQLKLVQDFRDPWSDNPYKRYGSEKRKALIKEWQDFAIAQSDHCVFVTQGLADLYLKGQYKPHTVISNGHDMPLAVTKDTPVKNQWLHIGNLQNGRDQMADALFSICSAKPELLNGSKIVFYGDMPNELARRHTRLFQNGTVVCNGRAHQSVVHKELRQSKVALQFNSDRFPYLVSTKVYEYAASGVPTLSINGGGEIDRLVKENDLGVSTKPSENELTEAMRKISTFSPNEKMVRFAKQTSYSAISQQYAKLLDSL